MVFVHSEGSDGRETPISLQYRIWYAWPFML